MAGENLSEETEMRVFTKFTAIAVVTVMAASPAQTGQNFGSFPDPIKLQLDPDGVHAILLERVRYIDPQGVEWEAPAGFRSDGASIPRWAWTWIGAPWNGRYVDAALIHDYGCVHRPTTWETVHYRFYLGMRARDVEERQAKIMYAAVYHFGPRWAAPGQTVAARSLSTEAQFGQLHRLIELREEGALMETADQARARVARLFAAAEAEWAKARTVETAEVHGLNGSLEKFAKAQAGARIAANRTANERAFADELLRQTEGEVTAWKVRLSTAQQSVRAARERVETTRVLAADPVPVALPPMELREIETVTPAELAAVP